MKEIKLPEIAMVLLVAPSSAGKSTFAKRYFGATEVVSSDYCRALVSDDENNLAATDAAFRVLQTIAAERLKLGKLVVVDALNLRKEDRAKMLQIARDNYALAATIMLDTPFRTIFHRHADREDRTFGKNVLEKQYDDFKRSLRSIEREGFTYNYVVKPEENIGITRQPLWNNKKNETGGFDIIGDVHSCFDELVELLHKLGYTVSERADGHFDLQAPEGRRLIFLGDLIDRGNKAVPVLRLVMDLVKAELAFCICGNHDDKLYKYLSDKPVNIRHGLEQTVEQLATASPAFKQEVRAFIAGLVSHYVLDGGKLVVAHGGLPEAMHGRAAAAVRAFCLYGETAGEIDEFGLPVRYDWAKDYKGKATVVYGHTPVPQAEWLNNTINIDTGCVFGGQLTALRYPERELIAVNSHAVYYEPTRPLVLPAATALTAQQEEDDLLDINIIGGKYLVETQYDSNVVIREENAVAALEVMSRFAINPKWLIYLPPTMSPPESSSLPNYLEHPNEVFDYYRRSGQTALICEAKHMGSRAIAIICRSPEVARQRFGLLEAADGIIYTRTGRRFFDDLALETQFLEVIKNALTAADFWDKHSTDWVCLDGELLPWNAKAKDLILKQYASVGAAAKNGLSTVLQALQTAKARGVDTQDLDEKYAQRAERIGKYTTAYRQYCQPTDGIEGLMYAPFHILATEGKTYFEETHLWHLQQIDAFAAFAPKYLMVTAHRVVDLEDAKSCADAVAWWQNLTENGGEGMVVKPLQYIAKNKGRNIQPAMKCRGSEYLRIIYGAEYDLDDNLQTLKARYLKTKRIMALQEFALGLESLHRFVNRAPLRQTHQAVFGVLALESEAIDPRL
jgi:protein phosphatase